jgi:hypothetical protein
MPGHNSADPVLIKRVGGSFTWPIPLRKNNIVDDATTGKQQVHVCDEIFLAGNGVHTRDI